jgi:hypothetical protein
MTKMKKKIMMIKPCLQDFGKHGYKHGHADTLPTMGSRGIRFVVMAHRVVDGNSFSPS